MDDVPHLILEVSEAHAWPALHGNTSARCIPLVRRPIALQPSRAVAEQEALRLARRHPGKRFAIFAPVLIGMSVEVPTHVTLGGQMVASALLPKLVQLGEPEDGVPF